MTWFSIKIQESQKRSGWNNAGQTEAQYMKEVVMNGIAVDR